MNTKRQKFMNFRLSDSEYQQLQARIKDSGFNSQQYLIRAVLEKPIVNKDAFQELLIELRKQGVNLNQIARAVNSGQKMAVEESLNVALKKYEKLWQSIRLFLEFEYQGVDLKKVVEACNSTVGTQEEKNKNIKEELEKVCQFLKL